MFIVKNKYFLLVESTKDFDLENIKIRNKFSIIYRNYKRTDKIEDLLIFRKNCKKKSVKFYVANDLKLAIMLRSDGIYLPSFNKHLKFLRYKRFNFAIIGSAHNFKEIIIKNRQGCSYIFLSKLFLVDYSKNDPFHGVLKFNCLSRNSKKIIALGGIKEKNLNLLNSVFGEGIALLSEIKKKPANIINRLF